MKLFFKNTKRLDNTDARKVVLENGESFLELKRKFPDITDLSKGGPSHSARAIVMNDGNAVFQVFLKPKWNFKLMHEDGSFNIEAIDNLLSLFDTQHYLCVGVSYSEFESMSKNVHINLKNKEEHKSPFERITSSKCQAWFKVGQNLSKAQKAAGATCGECKTFYRYVKRMNLKNRGNDGEVKHQERLKSTSNFIITKLTPISKQKRLKANSWKRGELQKKVAAYETKLKDYEINLSENQNNEMERVVNWINQNAVNELETLFIEGIDSDENLPDLMKEVWNKDTQDRSQFYRDQFTNEG